MFGPACGEPQSKMLYSKVARARLRHLVLRLVQRDSIAMFRIYISSFFFTYQKLQLTDGHSSVTEDRVVSMGLNCISSPGTELICSTLKRDCLGNIASYWLIHIPTI